MNPYSPPESSVVEEKPKPSVGQRVLGGICVVFGGLMLLGGIPQLIGALRMVINPDLASVQAAGSPVGYLLGTLVGLALAFLLFRFGLRKFRSR